MKKLHIWRTKDGKSHEIFSGTEKKFLDIKEFYCKEWRLNGKIHRENGPARIFYDGTEHWFQNGRFHRTDGPAVVWPNGIEEYWINGDRRSSNISCTVDEYKQEIDRLKQIEIEYNKLKNTINKIFSN